MYETWKSRLKCPLERLLSLRNTTEAGKEQESGLLAGAFGSLNFRGGIIFQTLYWETILADLSGLAVEAHYLE